MSLYLDASVLVPMFVREPATDDALRLVGQSNEPPIVSDLGAAEFASALSRLVRMRAMTRTEATGASAHFDEWVARAASRVETPSSDLREAERLLRERFLPVTTPDVVHAATARRMSLSLATLDQRLAEVARSLGVSVVGA